jgi:hypothetical protein
MMLGVPFVWPTGEVAGDWAPLSFVNKRFATELERWYGVP